MTTPFLSVVVPTWNRASLLGACIQSLVTQDYPPDAFEVLVVDDGSTDGTAVLVRELSAQRSRPRVEYVGCPHGGLNAARNAGIGAARGEALCFVDDDELAPPDYLAVVATRLRAHPGAAGVGGPVRQAGRSRVSTCPRCSLGDVSVPAPATGVVPRLLGGNMALRRSTIERVGPFDESLSGRGDDTEWFARASLDFFYDPELFLWHRRDHIGLVELCRTQFRQGKTIPRAARVANVEWRPRWRRTAHYVGHAARFRCGNGLAVASRELGATFGWIGMRFDRPGTRSSVDAARPREAHGAR